MDTEYCLMCLLSFLYDRWTVLQCCEGRLREEVHHCEKRGFPAACSVATCRLGCGVFTRVWCEWFRVISLPRVNTY